MVQPIASERSNFLKGTETIWPNLLVKERACWYPGYRVHRAGFAEELKNKLQCSRVACNKILEWEELCHKAS